MRTKNLKIKSLDRKKDDLLRRLLVCKNTGQSIVWGVDDDELAKYIISDGYAYEGESKGEISTINLKGENLLRHGGYVWRNIRRWLYASSPIISLILGFVKCTS